TFDLAGFSETINGLSNSGAGSSTVDSTLVGTPTLSVGNNNATSAFSGIVQNGLGTLGLAKIGTGTLTLSGANAYSGDTTITNGTLKYGAATTIPSGSGKGNVAFNPTTGNTATLDIGGFSPTINGLSSSGAGASVIDNSVAGTFTL